MAITKIHAIKSTLGKALAYIENPDKTDGQMLVSGYNCEPQTASIDFEMTAVLAHKARNLKRKRSTNLAYHLIQSFSPEDAVTPEQAHELGKKLAFEYTGGKYEYVVATHIDKGHMQFSNREQPWVVDDKLIIDDSMLEFMDMAKTISDNGYDLNVDPWAPEWSAAVESDDTFCYVLPTWGYQFVVKPAADKTKGQWGLCQGPVPYVKGGTWLGIYKDSPNKDLAWAFMQYVTCNSEAQQAYAKEYGEYVSLKSADQALAAEDGEEVLGGQNLYQFYNEQMEKIPADLMTAYDGQLNTFFLSDTKLYATGEMSKEEAIEQFKKDALNAYPELTVD